MVFFKPREPPPSPVASSSTSNSATMSAAFQFVSREILEFCKLVDQSNPQNQSLNASYIDELTTYKCRLDETYEAICMSGTVTGQDLQTVIATYAECRKTYFLTRAILRNSLDTNPSPVLTSTQLITSAPANHDSFLKVPPCDTEVFAGSYEKWPSFRDMFTAVYINHPRLSPVEKFFHLRKKTTGRAHAIVSSFSLNGDNFELAWQALKDRYENKRVLVDKQLAKLFNIKAMTEEKSEGLQAIQSTINDCINILSNHNVNTSTWDPILIYLCSSKLPQKTLSVWEQSLDTHKELPTWQQMDKFLTNRYEVVERLSTHNVATPPKVAAKAFVAQDSPAFSCKECQENHGLLQCPVFNQLSPQDKSNYISENNFCLNCLKRNHTVEQCRSRFSCGHCKRRHHSSLCFSKGKPQKNQTPKRQNQEKSAAALYSSNDIEEEPVASTSTGIQSFVAASNSQVLLPTALVQIEHLKERFTFRALIDQGSQRSFLSEKVITKLQLPTIKRTCHVSGMGQSSQISNKECIILLTSAKNNFKAEINTVVLPKLTNWLPSSLITNLDFNEISGLDLADPQFWRPGPVDLVLGSDIYPQILLRDSIYPICGTLLAQKTVFGWYFSGPVAQNHTQAFSVQVTSPEEDEEPLDNLLRKFWEQEEVPNLPQRAPEDIFCEDLYQKTTYRDDNGKYVVKLPFKEDFPQNFQLGSSKKVAYAQFTRMEAKLTKTPELFQTYNSVLKEYLTLGHMEPAKSNSDIVENRKILSYYLPHHAVLRPESKTTKVRVVFNASQKTSSSLSLNDVLHTGPILQADVVVTLLNWRPYKYVFFWEHRIDVSTNFRVRHRSPFSKNSV